MGWCGAVAIYVTVQLKVEMVVKSVTQLVSLAVQMLSMMSVIHPALGNMLRSSINPWLR